VKRESKGREGGEKEKGFEARGLVKKLDVQLGIVRVDCGQKALAG